ncbi:unnamed protein product [Eruca vesicaria subsp. sativa]|uniref:Proton pump-interactor 4 n=1 Tax=Eruca vesicaria subsp. sativa TaxID=29727 RepID=A0ABC8JNI7_ERUVS|nr:unnamed protein product [Eruca vesicaria subsp. sativa]
MGSPVSLCDGGLDAPRLVIAKSNGDLSSRETTEEEDFAVFSGEEEEWCGENRFCFYFVKQFAYDDPEIKAKIDEADNEIYNCNSERIHISNRLKAIRAERLSMENVMKDQEVNSLSERLNEIKMEMELLEAQMGCVLDQRDRAFERIKFLRIQRDKGNAAFFQSRVVMKKAVELAASGNVRDLEELANSEVDKFMSRWNNDKGFRDDYKKRILPSLEERKLRRDERVRSSEGSVDTENRDETAIELKRFSTEEEEESDEKLEKEEEEIVDKETLKEKKREEQLEKARLAMERKRKLHEKAAAKAAIRVKKEAEKKLKELEKRAKKKKKASSNSSTPSDLEKTPETVTEGSEPEKTGKEKPLNGRSVSWKQRSFLRYRHHKKGNETVPKAILKRRRAYRLWVWSVSSAAVALPLALLIVFFYLR